MIRKKAVDLAVELMNWKEEKDDQINDDSFNDSYDDNDYS